MEKIRKYKCFCCKSFSYCFPFVFDSFKEMNCKFYKFSFKSFIENYKKKVIKNDL